MDFKKAYGAAFERAKGIYNENPSFSTEKFVCGQIFPELKESEDERIRKYIVFILNEYSRMSEEQGFLCNKSVINDALAYLEKQKDFKYSEEQMEDIRQYAYNKGIVDTEERQKEKQPAEWSEEDETAYGDLIWCIEQAKKSAKDENDMGNIWFAENWVKNHIKSLRPQPHWKPSEEQMEALKEASTSWMNEHMGNCELLKSLYNDLKSYKS